MLKYLCLFALLFSIAAPQTAKAAGDIEVAGDILQVLIPVTGYVGTFCMDDEEGRMQFYKSFFTTFGVTHGLKRAINKERPNGGNHSFPSGHTSAAFQGAAFLQKRYGWSYGIPAYIGAGFVGYSRVESDHHYTSDVLAGAAIGIISSFYFTEPYHGVSITPTANNGEYGLLLSTTW